MLANVNALLIAWAVSLIIVVGGVLTLEATHTPNTSSHNEDATTAAEKHSDANDANTPGIDAHQPINHDDAQQQTHTPVDTHNKTKLVGMPAPGQKPTMPTQTNTVGSGNAFPSTEPAQASDHTIPAVALPDLLEQSTQGPLPKRADDGRSPYQVYAAAHPRKSAKAKISLMVTDLGMRSRITRRALADLPTNVSLAFSPYSPNLNGWGEQARRAGFEVFLTVPMEPVNYPQNDPGPLTLLTGLSNKENKNILKTTMQKLTGYVGIVNHMGSRFTAASESIKPVLEEVHKRGLMFVDSRTTPYSRAAVMAKGIGMPVAINNGYIDEDLAQSEIASELTKLEQRAQSQGAAMGLARPYPVTLNAIKVWAATLEERGFILVPVTAIANLQAIPR